MGGSRTHAPQTTILVTVDPSGLTSGPPSPIQATPPKGGKQIRAHQVSRALMALAPVPVPGFYFSGYEGFLAPDLPRLRGFNCDTSQPSQCDGPG